MTNAGAAAARDVRGRVVMLVDNTVTGDSRVQKEAMSAAASGWDVILVGRSPDGQPQSWSLGQAQVRLVPMSSALNKRAHEFRRPWSRPFAYPPNGVAAYRSQLVKGWQADLRARRAALRLAAASPHSRASLTMRRIALRLERLAAKVRARWVSFRYRQLVQAQRSRRRLDGPRDRAYALFWRLVMGDRCWRRLEPRLWDYELAFGKVIDELTPDLIHANDFYMLGVAARAKLRARAAGRTVALVWDVHEFLPGLKSRADNVRWLPAHCAYEREYAPFADAVVTVSEELGTLLREEHGLATAPAVVLNAPVLQPALESGPVSDVREQCGLDATTPLLVYSGAAAPQRGLGVLVEALPWLVGVHVALVVGSPSSRYVRGLVARAVELGVGARLHVLGYVPHERVVSFLAGADVGVIPIQHWPNHEIALITKFFEYAHARLPVVVSDVRTMAQVTRSCGLGEVFRADDVDDFVRAVREVLADPKRYQAAYDRAGLLAGWTWEAQAEVLDQVYRRLLPGQTRRSTAPDVSVVMAIYNAMPYLTRCIRSLLNQSLGLGRFEVIGVDDGSTDGSAERFGRFAELYPDTFKIVHQSNSGTPAIPSNRGLELATGRYVFFLGADDYLGTEALERMVAAADEYGSDVVVAKMVGVNGRYVPQEIFASTQAEVDLFNSPLPFALSNTKLFRRSLILEHGLRFPEGLVLGSDQPFTLAACIHARKISVLADYDYYFAVRRRNDANITYRYGHEDRLRCTEEIMNVTARLVEPGPRRDAINHRHFRSELSKLLLADFLELDRTVQERLCAGIGQLVEAYLSAELSARLDVPRRVRFTLAQRGHLDALIDVIRQDAGPDHPPIVVEGHLLYFGYRCLRDPDLALPDSLFLITDDLVESVATRLAITEVAWGSAQTGRRALMVTLHSPFDLAPFGPAPVRMNVGEVCGEVTLARPADRPGTMVRCRFPVRALLAQSHLVGERREVRVCIDVNGSSCDAPVRLPVELRVPIRFIRRGVRPYGIKPAKNIEGNLVVDIVPVTANRITRRLRRTLGQGRMTT